MNKVSSKVHGPMDLVVAVRKMLAGFAHLPTDMYLPGFHVMAEFWD